MQSLRNYQDELCLKTYSVIFTYIINLSKMTGNQSKRSKMENYYLYI